MSLYSHDTKILYVWGRCSYVHGGALRHKLSLFVSVKYEYFFCKGE